MAVSPVRVKASAGCTAATLVFRRGRDSFVTAVVKASFALVPGDVGRVTAPDPIADGETLEPDGRVRTAGDLVPFLTAADVLLSGVVSGAAVGGPARLGYFRGERILLDKTFALGPRTTRGVAVAEAGGWPRAHPQRVALLGTFDRSTLEGAVVMLPAELEPRYFHAAPPDQRVGAIVPGDGLLLDGVVPGHPRFMSRVPELAPRVFLHGPGSPPEGVPFTMRGDTLVIDVERAVATITFRGFLKLTSGAPLHRVSAEVVGAGQAAPAGLPPTASAKPAPRRDLGSTVDLDADSEVAAARAHQPLPFHKGPAVFSPPHAEHPLSSEDGSTENIDDAAVRRIRAELATPFEQAKLEPRHGITADIDENEVRRIRAQLAAIPLAPAGPALEPDDESGDGPPTAIMVGEAAGPAMPFVAGVPMKLESSDPPRRRSLGETHDVAPEGVRELRARLLPFGAPNEPAPRPPTSVAVPQPPAWPAAAPPPAMPEVAPAVAAAPPARPVHVAIPRARTGQLEETESLAGLGAAFLAALEAIEPRAA